MSKKLIGFGVALAAIAAVAVFHGPILEFFDRLEDQPFNDKLGEVKDEFGDEVLVISVTAGNGGATFELLQPPKVQIRKFNRLCSGDSCDYEAEKAQRPATAADRAAAQTTLGTFDKDLLYDMFDDAGVDDDRSLGQFDGTQWQITSDEPGKVWIAAADGSGVQLQQAKGTK